ncbi:MAG: hypothetical protein BGO98_38670 [Myxococcales bacterium 68-20]|nr:MAG: hypothetical protein BGO98_38670 [Myxococcales bacterium 68-20]
MTTAVVNRWDGFLAQMRERFVQIMGEAREGCPMLLQQSNFDPLPMGNAWSAIELRAKQLESKLDDTWNDQVEPTFEQAGAPPDVLARERAKGETLRDWFEVERERTRIQIWSNAGRAFYQRARAELGRPFACVRCGAPLEIPFTYRALNVPCPHCRTMNGFEPGTYMRMGETCVHPLSEEAAWPAWLAMRQAEKAWRAARPVTIHHLKAWERAQIDYWRAYLTARVQLLPDTAHAFEADLRGKMRAFYDQMDREGPWVQAGRPRDLV